MKPILQNCPVCGVRKMIRADQKYCSKECSNLSMKKEKNTPEETHHHTENTWDISLPQTRISTLDALIAHCKIDLGAWTIDRWVCNKWEVGTAFQGKIITEPLYQVKAWLKKKVSVITAKQEIEALKELAKTWAPRYRAVKRPKKQSGNLLEINITDHHFGKLAWGKETGHEDYDTDIAERLWDDATNTLLARVSEYNFDQIVFVLGNDLLHADTKFGTTTHGTPLDTDSRYHKNFGIAKEAAIRSIEKLLSVAPVRIIVMPGNHDELSAFHLGDSLDCWFHKCSEVQVQNEPTPRKYLEWGTVMLMWTHGYKGKLSQYPAVMSAEQPEMWGRTTIREVHTGDKHQRRLEEFHGVAVRILPTLCAPDDWHSRMCFVGNQRMSEAYVWSKAEGLIGTAVYSVPTA